MSRYFYATLLSRDTEGADVPNSVEFGSATSENGAAHIAVRLANRMQQDTCVMEMLATGSRVIQKIRYRGEEIPEQSAPKVAPMRSGVLRASLEGVSLTKNATRIVGFLLRYVTIGYTVTITQDKTKDSATFVNIIASKAL
jgi:hypothetical protein